tara:strand:+ start:1570 stop:2343 length:774 start_codon:yes stop_codon:yes gene_type:complete
MRYYFLIPLFLLFNFSNAQNDMAFKTGEWFKYKLSYSGWFKAGEATVNLNEDLNNNQLLHAKMIGKSTGAVNLFFKVHDRYESYFHKKNIKPYRFIRNINEGGYTKNIEILFDQTTKVAKVNNFKKKSSKDFSFNENSQDMVSVFYYLRNFFRKDDLDKNNEIAIDMFFDSENYSLKIKYLSTEIINTNFGKILCHKIQPYVQSGRVFKKDESLTMWISADKNRIPMRIKADLLVGSIRIDLDSFSNLNHPFVIKFD